MAKRSDAKKAELKANYASLRAAGFSILDAQRLRSASKATVDQAVHTTPEKFRQARPLSERHARAGGGAGTRYKHLPTFQQSAPLEYPVHKGRIKNNDYIEIDADSERKYANAWAYKMTYVVVDENGLETRKFFTILPDEKMTKKELKEFVWENCKEAFSAGTYAGKAVKSSIQLIGAYHNADWD